MASSTCRTFEGSADWASLKRRSSCQRDRCSPNHSAWTAEYQWTDWWSHLSLLSSDSKSALFGDSSAGWVEPIALQWSSHFVTFLALGSTSQALNRQHSWRCWHQWSRSLQACWSMARQSRLRCSPSSRHYRRTAQIPGPKEGTRSKNWSFALSRGLATS